MPNLEDLASSDSCVLRYVCLQPWEREERPLEEHPAEQEERIYIKEIPDEEYIGPEEKPYDPYEPKRGVVIIQY